MIDTKRTMLFFELKLAYLLWKGGRLEPLMATRRNQSYPIKELLTRRILLISWEENELFPKFGSNMRSEVFG